MSLSELEQVDKHFMCTEKWAYQMFKMYNKCNGLQYVGQLQYLPYNGRHHSLIWEKKANDLDETRE